MAAPAAQNTEAAAAARLDFVKNTLSTTLGFKVRNVSTVAYENGFPFAYNNFVFAVEAESNTNGAMLPSKPGAQQPTADESMFIFRLANPTSGYNDEVRIENEVAMLSLARAALQPSMSHLVPRVYAWSSAGDGKGWILQQHMPGENVSESFASFCREEKTNLLQQMADILACLQRFDLPSTIEHYGGVGFNSSGNLVSTQISMYDSGPFLNYGDLHVASIMSQLRKADVDPNVDGWRDDGIRAGLDAFLEGRITTLFANMASQDKRIVHADFTIDNILYDSSNHKITAILDFDFSHIGTVADDFLRSFGANIGRFPNSRDCSTEEKQLRDAMLYGFPKSLPATEGEVDWVAAEIWDQALEARGLQRPANLPSLKTVADAIWLSDQIVPFRLCNPVVVENSTPEELSTRKQEYGAQLSGFLSDYGC